MKPVKITFRDACIISAIAAVAAIIILWVTNWYSGASSSTSDYILAATTSFTTSWLAQFISEYSGLNGALAKESIEYSRGSALSGYQLRRMAQLDEIYYNILASRTSEDNTEITNRRDQLRALMANPGMSRWLSEKLDTKHWTQEQTLSGVRKIFGEKYLHEAKLLAGMPREDRKLSLSLSARATPEQIKTILLEGFGGVEREHAWVENLGLVPKIKISDPEDKK